MKSAFIESPLGITKVVGDVNGISDISVLNEGEKWLLEHERVNTNAIQTTIEFAKDQR